MLGLPPVPAGYVAARDGYVGVYSVIACQAEQAGLNFYLKYERTRRLDSCPSVSPSSADADEPTGTEEDNLADTASSGPAGKRKKNFKEHSSIHASVRKAVEDEHDLYELLCVARSSSPDELKKSYRKLALVFHPDKRKQGPSGAEILDLKCPDPAKMSDDEMKHHFLKVQNAFEILSDDALRKQYDSSLPFDEDLPTERDITAENFFTICGPAFEKESVWSVRKPVPTLGDANTPIAEVKRFYKFWADFESWRDFSNAGEHNISQAMDRDERRWMQKENWKVVSKLIKQERQRVHKFVTTAEAKDPRILMERDGERLRKEKIKADKVAAIQAAQQAVLDAKRESEEAQRLAEEEAAKELALKKKNEKRLVTDLRKRIRQPYKIWCAETGTPCEFTADDLQDFTINANIDMLKRTAEAIGVILSSNESAEPAQSPSVCEEVAKTIRQYMSEWNAVRYKASSTPKSIATTPSVPEKVARVWTPEELSILAKGLVKYPGGTANRWTQIAKLLGEDVSADDVVTQARKLNDSKNLKSSAVSHAVNANAFEQSQKLIPASKKHVDAAPDVRDPSTISDWTPEQQTALEGALARHPPTMPATKRWQAIAADVSGKSAKECLARFKEIREAIIAAGKVESAAKP